VYEAPVKVVWDAWTDLQQVEKWWGPRGFTVTTKSKDLHPSGKWIYTLRGPDGTEYPNITTYHVVLKYEKLVYDHGGNDEREKLFTVSVTFKEDKGKTTMRMVYTLPTAEEAKNTKHFIKQANGHSTWDRLGEFLENKMHGKDSFMITRSFATTLSSMFDMWINPQSFSSWLGPAGSTMQFMTENMKEGGSSLWSMTTDDGQTKYGKINYLKISAPSTLIYTQNFCNKDGKLCKPAFAPTYPDSILTTVLLTEEAPTQTRVTVKWEVHGDATEVERKTFHDMKSQMTIGWNSSFDKIDAIIGF
jgi:uncharacterized protein YndB with AHSA1/START domain